MPKSVLYSVPAVLFVVGIVGTVIAILIAVIFKIKPKTNVADYPDLDSFHQNNIPLKKF